MTKTNALNAKPKLSASSVLGNHVSRKMSYITRNDSHMVRKEETLAAKPRARHKRRQSLVDVIELNKPCTIVTVKLEKEQIRQCQTDIVKRMTLVFVETIDVIFNIVVFLQFVGDLNFNEETTFPVYQVIVLVHASIVVIFATYSVFTLYSQISKIRVEIKDGISLKSSQVRIEKHDGQAKPVLQNFDLARAKRNKETAKKTIYAGILEDLVTIVLVAYRLFYTDFVFSDETIECLNLPERPSMFNCLSKSNGWLAVPQINLAALFLAVRVLYYRDVRDMQVLIEDHSWHVSTASKTMGSILDLMDTSDDEYVQKVVNFVVEVRRIIEYDRPYDVKVVGFTDLHALGFFRKKNNVQQTLTLSRLWVEHRMSRGIHKIRQGLMLDPVETLRKYMLLGNDLKLAEDTKYFSETKQLIHTLKLGASSSSVTSKPLNSSDVETSVAYLGERILILWEYFAKVKTTTRLSVVVIIHIDAPSRHENIATFVSSLLRELDKYPFLLCIHMWKCPDWFHGEIQLLEDMESSVLHYSDVPSLAKKLKLSDEETTKCLLPDRGLLDPSKGISSDMFNLTENPVWSLVLLDAVLLQEMEVIKNVLVYLRKPLDSIDCLPPAKLHNICQSARDAKNPESRFSVLSQVGSELHSSYVSMVGGSQHSSLSTVLENGDEDTVQLVSVNKYLKTFPTKKLEAHTIIKAWLSQLKIAGAVINVLASSPYAALEILCLLRDMKGFRCTSRYGISSYLIRDFTSRFNRGLLALNTSITEGNKAISGMGRLQNVRKRWNFDPFFDFSVKHNCCICLFHTRIRDLPDFTDQELYEAFFDLLEYYLALRRRLSIVFHSVVTVQFVFVSTEWDTTSYIQQARFRKFVSTLEKTAKIYTNLVKFPLLGIRSRGKANTILVSLRKTWMKLKRQQCLVPELRVIDFEREAEEQKLGKSSFTMGYNGDRTRRRTTREPQRVLWSWEDSILDSPRLEIENRHQDNLFDNPMNNMPLSELLEYFQ